ncbi:MAG: lipid A deacylase LpxR family protein [Pseudomonadota bacterium]
MVRNRLLALAMLTAAFAPAAHADEPEQGTFNFVLENDIVSGFDRDYTNGVQLSWTSGPDRVPSWAIDAARLFPLFPETGRVRASFALGQSIYTPNDITLRNPPAEDRPYAGWLYGSIGLIAETGTRLDQLQLQVGVVGPASLAEQTQTTVHEIVGADKPRGWDTQLENEPGVVLTYQRSWRAFVSGEFLGFSFDATPHIGGALGNVFTYANGGATLRLGWNLPNDYGPPRIEPSLPGSGFFEPQGSLGMYIFAGLDGRAVARNIFLDGNTWQDSRSVEKEPLVGDAQVGFAVTLGSVRLAYTHVFRTQEFASQHGADKFGAVSLSLRF